MKSLKTRAFLDPRPPHSEIFNSGAVFFAGRTCFEGRFTDRLKIKISKNNTLDEGHV